MKHEKAVWDLLLATPISFYGKVVDENGKPVPAATINTSFADTAWTGHTKGRETTDANGLFHASGHGLAIVVAASKEGYYHMRESAGSFTYSAASGNVDTHTDPSNPATFVLKTIGKTENLVSFEHCLRISKDGTPLQVDLATGWATKVDRQAIKVEAWTNDAGHRPNSNQPYDWRCRISVPGGGLTGRTDTFDFVAPEGGYQPEDEINMPAAVGNPNWRSQVSRNYFVKLASGNYARVGFTMTAGGDHFITVASYLNPSGSRNLEAGQPRLGATP